MILVLMLVLFIFGLLMARLAKNYTAEFVGQIAALIFGASLFVMMVPLVCMHVTAKGEVEKNKAVYESLVHQYENNFYDNDNDVGKKELIREIQDWNSDLAFYQSIQRDFWIGVFVPNIYDQFEFIELDKTEGG